MIPKGAIINYGEYVECYRGYDGCLVIWYRRDTFGPEWASMSYTLIFPDT